MCVCVAIYIYIYMTRIYIYHFCERQRGFVNFRSNKVLGVVGI